MFDEFSTTTELPLSSRIQRYLDGSFYCELQQLRDWLAKYDPVETETPRSEYRQGALDFTVGMVGQGLSRLTFGAPEEQTLYFLMFEEIPKLDMSFLIKQGVNYGLGAGCIHQLGTEKHRAMYLEDIGSGKRFAGLAMTEDGGGADVQNLRTTITYDREKQGFTIHTPSDDAKKSYIGDAALHGHIFPVFGQLYMSEQDRLADEYDVQAGMRRTRTKGIHAVVAQVRDEHGQIASGVRIEDNGHKNGLNGVDNGRMAFDHFFVPYDAFLDRFARIENGEYKSDIESKGQRFYRAVGTLVGGRISLALASVAASKVALKNAIRFASERTVKHGMLLDTPNAQDRLAPLLAEAVAHHIAARKLLEMKAEELKTEKPNEDIDPIANVLKARMSARAFNCVDMCREINGGPGYISETRYEQLRDDLDVFRTFEGPNDVLLMFASGQKSNELNAIKAKKSTTGKLLITASSLPLTTAFIQKGRTAIGYTSNPETLLRRENTLEIFRQKEKMLRHAVLWLALKKQAFGVERNVIEKDLQLHARRHGNAIADLFIVDAFTEFLDNVDDLQVKAVFTSIFELYVADLLQRDHWALENNLISQKQSRALRHHREAVLYGQVAENALSIVDAFAVSDNHLSAAPYTPAVSVASRDIGLEANV